ncbi:hypothetical protein ZWY2020_037618, partial [Hordeum vulgare]
MDKYATIFLAAFSPARFTGKRVLHISSLAPSLLSSNPNISSLTPAPNADAASRAAVGGPMLNMVFEAAFDGDLRLFKSLLLILDNGRGRLKETVEALRVKDAGLLEGLGALHVAACRDRLEVCKYLIEELQVDVNGVDERGRTPLFFAIRKGAGIVKYLLEHGADPNKVNSDGISLLHEATMSGNGETVKLLLTKGAYVDPVASCGTPLHCAASKGHDDIMKILLAHNADCNKLVNGKTPLIIAEDANSRNCIFLLLKEGGGMRQGLGVSSPLYIGVEGVGFLPSKSIRALAKTARAPTLNAGFVGSYGRDRGRQVELVHPPECRFSAHTVATGGVESESSCTHLNAGFSSHLNHSKVNTILSYYIIDISKSMLAFKTNHYKLS